MVLSAWLARVAELADAPDLGSGGETRAGSSPASRIVLGLASLALTSCAGPWAADFVNWPLDTSGYEVETLSVVVTASYARGDDVYLGLETGEIKLASDANLAAPWTALGQPFAAGPRLVFASTSGVVFVAGDANPLSRSADDGATWQVCLDVPVWRMDEDDEGSLYAGNYTHDDQHVATLYKSVDRGGTWSSVFVDPGNKHIHTVRWDERGKRLYIAFGDGPTRGQAYSDDHGATFVDLARGPHEGHTDVVGTRDYVLWCTDNSSGQVLRTSRATGETQVLTIGSQFLWFGVADDEQMYVGTAAGGGLGRTQAVLLASRDQGTTWQKVAQSAWSPDEHWRSLFAESRKLSAGGWLYCSVTDGDAGRRSFRVRWTPTAGGTAKHGG
jgi:hypothetical protein